MEKQLADLLNKSRKIHFVGIGGVGMSAIARIMKNQGYNISGSDQKESRNTLKLREEGIKVFIGHKADNVRGKHVIVVSSAIDRKNPEMVAARQTKIPIIERAKALGFLMTLFKRSIAVAGTHGKTTTSSMAAFMLQEAKLSPTFLIGGEITNLNTNAQLGKGALFVAEADESDGSIQFLSPDVLVVTNLEEDHLDHFKDIHEIIDLFYNCVENLAKRPNHLLLINGEQWGNKMLLEKIKDLPVNKMTFGLEATNDIYASELIYGEKGFSFLVNYQGEKIGRLELSIPGEHNVLNALPVIALALQNDIDMNNLEGFLKRFDGAKRRFTKVGMFNNIEVFDDYAHHPTEIEATLKAARIAFPKKKIFVAFQPHRYSRTMYFSEAFAKALSIADGVIITNVYSAGESEIKNVSGETITKHDKSFIYIPKKEEIPVFLESHLRPGDIFITMGAGDIYTLGKELLNRLRQKDASEQNNDNNLLRFA